MDTHPNLEEESLFSLELVVDKVKLRRVACRFPAIAFRLLDFPTLMMYHVEPDLAKTIKDKINMDPNYQVPAQLTELQDREGYFPVKKGKSCLFRIPANTLRNHLKNVPLYVMIVDTYPETPKLLASCTVLLDKVMESVYGNIVDVGLSVPTVFGEKGKHSLYNLMGIELGHIFLGFRLLSLGVGLMAHIPNNQVITVGKSMGHKVENIQEPQEHKRSDDEGKLMVKNIKTTTDVVQVEMGNPESIQEHEVQEAWVEGRKNTKDSSAQTGRRRGKGNKSKTNLDIESQLKDELDDLVVTNSLCPPPLYYNSKDEMCLQSSGGHHMDDFSGSSDSEFGSDDTIREEDKFSDVDFEISEKIYPEKRSSEEDLKNKKDRLTLWLDEPRKNKYQVNPPAGFLDFPLLNALVSEVIALRGGQGDSYTTEKTKHKKQIKDNTQDGQKKEQQSEFISRLSSPRRPARVESGRQSPEIRKPPPQPIHTDKEHVPPITKNKGWLGNQQSSGYGVKKTKLTYGMTNTQRLRLAKGNPDLLKTLEKEEEDRVQKRREKNISKYPWLKQKDTFSKQILTDVSTEISKHEEDIVQPTAQVTDMVTNELLSPRRKPVPTPRLSLTDKSLFSSLQQKQLEGASGKMDASYGDDIDWSEADNAQKQRSVMEVHIPSGSDHDESYHTGSEANARDSVDDLDDSFGKTRIITDKHAIDKVKQTETNDDWDGEVPGLKRMVDVYSDDESTEKSVVLGDLQRTVNKYSDQSNSDSGQSDPQSYHSAVTAVSQNQDDDAHAVGIKKVDIHLPKLPEQSSSKKSTKTPTKLPPVEQKSGHPRTRIKTQSNLPEGSPRSARSLESSSGSIQFRPSSPRRPMPSPRRTVDLRMSQNTDSVSSYAPSEVSENISPLSPGAYYSDDFDDHNDSYSSDAIVLRGTAIADVKANSETKLGYTWS